MSKTHTTVSYEYLCTPSLDTDSKLEKTIAIYTKMADFAADFILSLHGGLSKEILGDVDETVLFNCWFSLEKHANVPGLSNEEIKERFSQYWGGDYNEELIDLILSFQKSDCVWVDRRISFASTEFTQSDLKSFFDFYPIFQYGEEEEGKTSDSYQFWRNFYSERFGNGKKVAKTDLLSNLISAQKILEQSNTTAEFYKELAVSFRNFKSAFSPGGRPNSFFNLLDKLKKYEVELEKDEYLEKLKKALSTLLKKWTLKGAANYSDAPQKLLESLTAHLGIVPARDNFAEGFSKADQQIRKTKTSACQAIARKIDLVKTYKEKSPSVEAELAILQQYQIESAKKANLPAYFIRKSQIVGYSDFRQLLNKFKINAPTEEEIQPLKLKDGDDVVVEAALYWARNDKKIGSYPLFKFLANHEGNFELAVELLCIAERIQNLRLGPFVHFRNGVIVNPSFGNSRPHVKLVFGQESLEAVELEVFNGKFFEKLTIPVLGKRGNKEVFFVNRENVDSLGPRNHPFKTPVNIYEKIKSDCGTLLCRKENWRGHSHFYLKLSPSLKNTAVSHGPKILGVDLGWKTAVAYSIIETGDGPCSFTTKNGKETKYKIVESGFWNIPERNSKVSDEELIWSKSLLTQMNWKTKANEADPRNRCQLFKNLAFALKTFAFKNPKEAYRILSEVLSIYLPRFSDRMALLEQSNWGVGGLSKARLDTIDYFFKAASTCLSKLAVDKTAVASLTFIVERLRSKYDNLRQERWRITANQILKLALENNVDVVVLEDLDGKTSNTNMSQLNRKISSWYVRKIQKYLKDNLALHGKKLKLVDKLHTSHQDADLETLVFRMNKVPTNGLSSNELLKVKKYAKKEKLTGTAPVYRKAAQEFLANNKLESPCDGYYPIYFGSYVYSKILNKIFDADQFASLNIALRWARVASGGVTFKTPSPLATD